MRDPRLRPFRGTVIGFLAFVIVQMASGGILFVRKMGFAATGVQAFYLGSEAAFTRPRTLAGLLEVAVPHLLGMPLVLFISLHLVAFVGLVHRRAFALLSGLSFGAALAGIAAGFGIRYLWPALAWAKIAAFVGLEALLLLWLVLLGTILWSGASAGSGAEEGSLAGTGSQGPGWPLRERVARAGRNRKARGTPGLGRSR